jgi:indolepyruvate ferredoxin oxidoreductase
MRSWGRLDADAMIGGLRERLATRLASRLAPEPAPARTKALIPLSVARTPFFCSGCPHNWGTKVPDDALVGAGTGCHGMSLLMDPERVGEGIGITAMGNEGAEWIGMEPFVEADHLFQNYGDGTFFHSAQLALQFCVAAGMHMTFKILYNGTVAMTGGQDATNQLGVPEMARILLAYGVTKVAITTEDPGRYAHADLPGGVEVHDRTEIVPVQEALRAAPGVTVLIHDQACAAELRRARKRGRLPAPRTRVVINHRVCEGCGDCGDVSNCLSVQAIDTPLGRKTAIDQATCNFDYSCVKGDCPAFMTVELSPEGPRARAVPAVDDIPVPAPHAAAERDCVRIRTAGIGGTGVVTLAQILSTAAMLDGWEVRGLDQTGLSQKAGPVVSDVVLARPGARTSNLVGRGQADVLLGFDALVAASDPVIAATDPATTVVIASTHRTPTGRMITQPGTDYPDAAVMARLAASGTTGRNRHVDAIAMVTRLVGTALPANLFLLGVAVQDGHIPVSPDAVERAVDLNGVAVEANLAAFGWGRRWADDPARVEAAAAEGPASDPSLTVTVPALPTALAERARSLAPTAELADLVGLLAADLVGFQDERYAAAFLDGVARAAAAEKSFAGSTELTEAVARSLHKLMAYKDEYEVARLLLLPEAQQSADAAAGTHGADFRWQLHPPMLRALGLRRKIALGPRARPALRALRAGKRLRGTRLDPFGRTDVRRTERALVGEFLDAMDTVYAHLSGENLPEAIEIAGLPDLVRGYEDLKMRRAAEFRRQIADRVRQLGAAPVPS